MLTIHTLPPGPPPAADSWTLALPRLVQLYFQGDDAERDLAATELARMAGLADAYQDAVSIVLIPA